MQQITLTSSTINAAGPVAGSAQSTAPIGSSDYTVTVEIVGMSGSSLRIGIEDSPDGSAWSPFNVWEIAGSSSQQAFNVRKYNAPGLQTGANAKARVNVYAISGSAQVNASIGYPE